MLAIYEKYINVNAITFKIFQNCSYSPPSSPAMMRLSSSRSTPALAASACSDLI